MRDSQSWARPDANRAPESRLWRTAAAARGAYVRGDAPPSLLDVRIDVQEDDLEGTVRIVVPGTRSSHVPLGRLEVELDLVDTLRPDIVRRIARPLRLETVHGGRLIASSAMRGRQDRGGEWEIVSHREDAAAFEIADARDERRLGRMAATVLGARHVCETGEMLWTPTLMQHVRMLAPYRTIVPTMPQRALAARLLERDGELALGGLAAALHPNGASGLALAYALVVRRCIAIDLDRPIGPDSVVRAARPEPAILPGLTERLRMHRRSA